MTLYRCGYCPANFTSLTELAIHREHEHPTQTKSAYTYFEALNRKYSGRQTRRP